MGIYEKCRKNFVIAVCCLTMALPMTAHAGYMVDIDGVKAYVCDGHNDAVVTNVSAEGTEIIRAAQAYQTYGSLYNADVFQVILLKKGDTVYTMLPGQGVFYTDIQTVTDAPSARELNYKLQVRPHAVVGLRSGLASYQLKMDMYVATGTCLNNLAYGNGGGKQFLIPNFTQQRDLYQDDLMGIKSWLQRPQAA